MSRSILGIHHITAIAGSPQANLDFYAGLLGLRLVKLTVNFDDPGTYHLYYGDGVGHPGTILTFFPWPHAPKGRCGTSQVSETAFAIPAHSLDFWSARLQDAGVVCQGPFTRFGDLVLSFSDPDGLKVNLIETPAAPSNRSNAGAAILAEHAIQGFHSATLSLEGYGKTAELLTGVMGFELVGNEGDRFRYKAASSQPAGFVDLRCAPEERPGRVGVGSVHHIAWRTPDDAQQRSWLSELTGLAYNVSPVMDRKYFHSIYFREPGNILFEIATDPPGFAVDEPLESLGTKLVLPPWLEPDRNKLEAILPPLRLPSRSQAVAS